MACTHVETMDLDTAPDTLESTVVVEKRHSGVLERETGPSGTTFRARLPIAA